MDPYPPLRSFLFRIDPEQSHHLALSALRALRLVPPVAAVLKRRFAPQAELATECLGLNFPGPVGLAAGYDKNALALGQWPALGFGFVEVGAVTPKPQAGNPKPRIFRYPELETIQNAMGFNNDGVEAIAKRMKKAYPLQIPLGVNIGKNKDTPLGDTLSDYRLLIERLDDACDFFVVNVSSPNTPGLRDLQNEAFFQELFAMTREATNRPVLLKLAPDGDLNEIVNLATVAVEAGTAGIIATNTTTDYALCPGSRDFGGLSGRVLQEKSRAVFEALATELFGRTVLVSVGGIDSGAEAWRRIKAGASLIQVYTALIFRGPDLMREIHADLAARMRAEGFATLEEAVGVDRA